jgi:ubiquinone/menaquinone biosynthesis C-methylase UbiE
LNESSLNKSIKAHYSKAIDPDEIIKKIELLSQNDYNKLSNALSKLDQFHVRGIEATKELLADVELKKCFALDLGCGIGGPARFLAMEKKFNVVGIDLNPDYILMAHKFTKMLGLEKNAKFEVGNATALPYSDSLFDMVLTQHVQMNIQNKVKFYSEISRVLKPGGFFVYYDIFISGPDEIEFPVPWAEEDSISFLHTKSNMHEILEQVNLKIKDTNDQTMAGIDSFIKMKAGIQENGLPEIGVHLLMGSNASTKIANLLTALQEGSIEIESGIAHKE